MTFVQFLKTREKTSIVLDLIEKTLYQMSLLVKMLVILSLFFPVLARRYHRLRFSISDFLQEMVCVIRAISNHALKFIPCDQIFGLSNVMLLSTSQQKAQRVAQSVYVGMDFSAESAPAAPQGLRFLTTFFWGAPAAQGCARTTVLSSSMFSISGSSAKC